MRVPMSCRHVYVQRTVLQALDDAKHGVEHRCALKRDKNSMTQMNMVQAQAGMGDVMGIAYTCPYNDDKTWPSCRWYEAP